MSNHSLSPTYRLYRVPFFLRHCVELHIDAEHMSRVLAKLREESVEISAEMLAGRSLKLRASIGPAGTPSTQVWNVTPINFSHRILWKVEQTAAAASQIQVQSLIGKNLFYLKNTIG